MNGSVVVIVSAFFIIGITVGIIAVIALSALRAHRPRRLGDPGDPPEYGRRKRGQPPDPDWQDSAPQHQPRWPGDTDNDFNGK